ncbi:MAG: pilus (MSHA type) biogenesis protein MshL [Pseudomonadota bacterium]
MRFFFNFCLLLALAAVVAGCGVALPERPVDGRHLSPEPRVATALPEVVSHPPVIEPPTAEQKLDLFTVEVHDVPVRELFFALARDAALNIDVHPEVSGTVTLNAVDQTLPQILARIARQVDLRWEVNGPNLIVVPDKPFLRTYKIDYVNISRKSIGEVSVATSISTTGDASAAGGSGGSGSNNSTTNLTQESNNQFWQTLLANINGIIETGGGSETSSSTTIMSNPETGLLTVRATARQHEDIQHFIDLMLTRALHQVLIEATVVEVRLSDQYQTGVDWSVLGRDGGSLSFSQNVSGANFASSPVTTLTLDKSGDPEKLLTTITMLEQFGDLKVLSSPKLMVLNNQTAMLKVVDNKIYFTIEVEVTPPTDASPAIVTYESTVHTVPIGFVMAVTPQISESDQVTLNVRPTISRILGYVNDPSPALAESGVESKVPEVQVREVESILKVASGQIAVLGGLMQDSVQKGTAGIPLLSRVPVLGNLFSYRDDTASKTELVIFLRPMIVRQASLDGELARYREYLSTPAETDGSGSKYWRSGP